MDALAKKIEALKALPVAELHQQHQKVFGTPATSRNKPYLAAKIARQGRKAATPRKAAKAATPARAARKRSVVTGAGEPRRPLADPRVPAAGTVIARTRKGKEHRVKVLSDGFEYQGKHFTSLSAVAQKITGHAANGFAFFRLGAKAKLTTTK